MKKKGKVRITAFLVIFSLLSYPIYHVIYFNFIAPVFKLEANYKLIKINGTEYMTHKLSYDGITYISEPLAYPYDYQIGKRIGTTNDGMPVYEVKNDKTRILINGDMFRDVFKKQ